MKKFLLVLFLIVDLAGARCFGQGEVEFNTHRTGLIVTRVYAPLSSDPTYHQTGNGPADTPVGAQDWSGFSLIGASGIGGQYGGGTTFAQLLGANGYNQPESSLQPAVPVTTFRTGSFAGFVTLTIATFSNLPIVEAPATLDMVAWDNISGLYPTWTQASVAWQSGLIAAGRSGLWNEDVITLGTLPYIGMIDGQDQSQHVVSFNLYFIPEPSTFALAAFGIVGILLHRRVKASA